ncbi:unnamed protein product [Microthlaspi erraticum]|uniref:Uncharacterized protein n=1 Tax=Microthlaspi erraticum TaxID=1685480 RepID=A0A6D2J802_9BRAS|nr:unnamed protein product [Microthlaspi erraticum]
MFHQRVITPLMAHALPFRVNRLVNRIPPRAEAKAVIDLPTIAHAAATDYLGAALGKTVNMNRILQMEHNVDENSLCVYYCGKADGSDDHAVMRIELDVNEDGFYVGKAHVHSNRQDLVDAITILLGQ